MGSHSVNCHPAEVKFQPLPQPIEAGTRFSDSGWMQGWVDLTCLVTHQSGIPARKRSPIPVLTGLNVERLRLCDERRYHNAKPQKKPIPRAIWYSFDTWLLAHPTYHFKRLSIRSAVFAGLTVVTNRQRQRPRNSRYRFTSDASMWLVIPLGHLGIYQSILYLW